MAIQLGIVMDPIGSIHVKKDSTFAMLLEAQARDWTIHYMEQAGLFVRDGRSYGHARQLRVRDQAESWFEWTEPQVTALAQLDIILMRKDPPYDMEYQYTTYVLERAQDEGVLIVNDPRGLRDVNEKFYTTWFPQCCPSTLVTRSIAQIREFLAEHDEIVVKPLDAMGGRSVFRLHTGDLNTNVILETLTHLETRLVMAQRFIPEIRQGDKRILLIDGEPVPYGLVRIPAPGESRGNLAAGARGVGVELTRRDRWICEQVGPVLRDKGLLFVGLDVIGETLTEINVTSPTCIREIDAIYDLNIAGQLLDRIEQRLK